MVACVTAPIVSVACWDCVAVTELWVSAACGFKPRCPTSGCHGRRLLATLLHSCLRPLPGSHRAPLALSAAASYLLQNEMPRQYFSQLTSPPNVDRSRGGTAVAMIGFNYPSVSLMHCAGGASRRLFLCSVWRGKLIEFFLSFTWVVFFFYWLSVLPRHTLSSIKARALKFTSFFAWWSRRATSLYCTLHMNVNKTPGPCLLWETSGPSPLSKLTLIDIT